MEQSIDDSRTGARSVWMFYLVQGGGEQCEEERE